MRAVMASSSRSSTVRPEVRIHSRARSAASPLTAASPREPTERREILLRHRNLEAADAVRSLAVFVGELHERTAETTQGIGGAELELTASRAAELGDDQLEQRSGRVGVSAQEVEELGLRHHEHVDVGEGADGRGPGATVDGGDLAEELSGVEDVQDHFPTRWRRDRDLHPTALQEDDLRTVVLLAKEDVTSRVAAVTSGRFQFLARRRTVARERECPRLRHDRQPTRLVVLPVHEWRRRVGDMEAAAMAPFGASEHDPTERAALAGPGEVPRRARCTTFHRFRDRLRRPRRHALKGVPGERTILASRAEGQPSAQSCGSHDFNTARAPAGTGVYAVLTLSDDRGHCRVVRPGGCWPCPAGPSRRQSRKRTEMTSTQQTRKPFGGRATRLVLSLALLTGAGSVAALASTPGTSSAATPGTPTAPTAVTATPNYVSATVRWTAPASNNGSPITAYVVTPYLAGVAQTPKVFHSTATTEVVAVLTPARSYTFRVAATNVAGTGTQSQASAPVTIGTPTAPATVTATRYSHQEFVHCPLDCAGAQNGSPITGYLVTPYRYSPARTVLPALRFDATTTTRNIAFAPSCGGYLFSVAAINARGTGPQSAESNG